MYPKTLQQLIMEFKKLPGVGNKTAERYALHVLSLTNESAQELAQGIINTKTKIKTCKQCGHFTENDYCDICLDETRDSSIICVVASPKDILVLEKTQQFKGLYHVLGGLISPLNHVLPDDLSIDQLINRVDPSIKEVVLALNPTMEGETTSYYIAKKLQGKVDVTLLAQGLPMGGHLEYIDELTLSRSLKNRKRFDQ